MRWVTKIYYLELLRASEGTLSPGCLQSLTPPPVLRRVDVRQAAGRKNNCRIYHHHHHHQPINVPTAGAQAFLMD
jgi:hypothetical protein